MDILNWIKKLWSVLDKLSPNTRNLLIILLFGYILYTQITATTKQMIHSIFQEEVLSNKRAEKYSMDTSIEINQQIQMIAEKDEGAFNVLLLNYHNSTQSLQGYKYLYLSCLTEAPKYLDTPLLRQQWNKLDYIYYADELSRIHNQGTVYIEDLDSMRRYFPKFYYLLKASGAEAATFFTLEGYDSAIGLVVVLYAAPKKAQYNRSILHCVQRLSILLDYENNQK